MPPKRGLSYVSLVAWNMTGLPSSIVALARWVKSASPDILCLSETMTFARPNIADYVPTFQDATPTGGRPKWGFAEYIHCRCPVTIESSADSGFTHARIRVISFIANKVKGAFVHVYAPQGDDEPPYVSFLSALDAN